MHWNNCNALVYEKSPHYMGVVHGTYLALRLVLNCVGLGMGRSLIESHCHAPIPSPTRLADPNRFPGRETKYWDSLPDFFFFKSQLAPVGMAHIL